MAHMTQEQWDDYINIINEWQEDAFQQDITWLKTATVISKNGEDNNYRFKEINLKCLIQYNQFRAWPITQTTDSGETDKESILVYFNIKYLKDLGYTNNHDQFKFKPDYDRFLINGLIYKAFGESQVAQAGAKPLLVFIILKREEIETGKEKY